MAYNLRPRVAINEIKSKTAVTPLSSFSMVLRSSVAASSKAEKKTATVHVVKKEQKEQKEIRDCAKALVALSHGYSLRSK